MNRIALAILIFFCALLAGWLWPRAAPREMPATGAPTMTAPSSDGADVVARADPSGITAPVAATSGVATANDPQESWQRYLGMAFCARWNRMGEASDGAVLALDPDTLDTQFDAISALLHDADKRWDAARDAAQQEALLEAWATELHDACLTIGTADEAAIYGAAKAAALAGSTPARRAFVKQPPLNPLDMARYLPLWKDWADTAPRVLDAMVAAGDNEALFDRGLALGFDMMRFTEPYDVSDYLLNAIPDDPPRAYHDLHAYLASGDAQNRDIVQRLLPEVGKRLSDTQRAAIDAEFGVR